MTLPDFILNYDIEGNVVLLEGKRDVPEEDKPHLIALGKLLAIRTSKIIFRSGNAGGADEFFSEGVSSVSKNRLEVILPYSGHRKKFNHAHRSFSLDTIDLKNELEVIEKSKINKKTRHLIDSYISGDRNPYSIKAAYILRDTIKVLGTSRLPPANFGIFYDNLQNPICGGTGHTMKICQLNGVPIIDQRIWIQWLPFT